MGRVWVGCLEGVGSLSGMCEVDVWRVYSVFLDGVGRLSGWIGVGV